MIVERLNESEPIMVSVVCNTYNHGPYIAEALDGFVMQETNFPFEVLVHDDASTDNTADIIREYEKKYPEIIKPYYETENQYSKRDGSISRIQFGRAKGKYIALCEGDDYWTDPQKLQKQYEAMEKYPEIDMCAHAATGIQASNGQINLIISPRDKACVIPTGDVILGGGGFVATNSLFYRMSMRNKIPEFVNYLRLDYSYQIWGSLRGGMLFLPDNMSVYRMNAPGSWTMRMKTKKKEYNAHSKKVCEMLRILNEETFGRYQNEISERVSRIEFEILEQEQDYNRMKHGELSYLYKQLPLERKLKISVKQFLHALGLY
ncbi:MAG: glycosyltransferase [Ruminococcaceae bacterium]|jgi:glycosyltransferase involved in cell wall biosynthesis|nr:glycosyltransferase [Oscillospiraceae bacterium]